MPVDANTIPIQVFLQDSSGCLVEYNITQCKAEPCVNHTIYDNVMSKAMDIVFMYGHLHMGGINVTHGVLDGNTPNYLVRCDSVPTYGSGGNATAGNETGYLVGMGTCTYNPPIKIPAGSKFHMECFYHNDQYHDAVMCWSLFAAVDHGAWAALKEEFGVNTTPAPAIKAIPTPIRPPKSQVQLLKKKRLI